MSRSPPLWCFRRCQMPCRTACHGTGDSWRNSMEFQGLCLQRGMLPQQGLLLHGIDRPPAMRWMAAQNLLQEVGNLQEAKWQTCSALRMLHDWLMSSGTPFHPMLIGVCSSSSQLNRLAMLVRTTCSDTPNIILLVVKSCKSHMILWYSSIFPVLLVIETISSGLKPNLLGGQLQLGQHSEPGMLLPPSLQALESQLGLEKRPSTTKWSTKYAQQKLDGLLW